MQKHFSTITVYLFKSNQAVSPWTQGGEILAKCDDQVGGPPVGLADFSS